MACGPVTGCATGRRLAGVRNVIDGPVFDGPDDAAVQHFERTGWLLTQTLDADGVADLRSWVDEIAGWPDDGDGWLHHREMTDDGPEAVPQREPDPVPRRPPGAAHHGGAARDRLGAAR